MALGGAFVGLASVGKRVGAVHDDADRPVVEQASYFLQLGSARADLGCRDRDAQRHGFLGAIEDTSSALHTSCVTLRAAGAALLARARAEGKARADLQ